MSVALERLLSRKFILAMTAFVLFWQAKEYEKAWSVAGGYLGLQGFIDHRQPPATTTF